ncbi:hypothetical protein ABZ747_01365 [Kitasatospora cineracea]|uniref:DUF7691 family protein n=1 Tax=Kitasatospora cineracea TaxID=88074 RepID=UPI0033F167CD
MGTPIRYVSANKAEVLELLNSGGRPTEQQAEVLARVRPTAVALEERLVRQGVRSEPPVPEALEQLLAGQVDLTGPADGIAYKRALQLLLAQSGSDVGLLGGYRRPVQWFARVDDELKAAGVPAELLPFHALFGGPPAGFPDLGVSPDGHPDTGCFPLERSGAARDAYRAAAPLVDPECRADVQALAELFDVEDDSWRYGVEHFAHYSDTLFFLIG